MATPECPPKGPNGSSETSFVSTKAFARVLLAQLAIGFGFSIYFLLPKYLATELHADATSIGNVGATGLAAAVATTPLMGTLLDRYGRRLPMAASAALVIAGSLGMLRVHEIGVVLYLLRIVQGIGFGLGFNAAAAYVADIAPAGRLGQAMGLLGAASLLTNALAPALFESVAVKWGWAPVFSAASATGILTCLVSLVLPEPDTSRNVATALAPSNASTARLGYASWVTGAAFGTLITFTQPFALSRGAERVSTYLIGYTLGALLVRIVLGNFADRVGRLRVARWSLFGYGAVALLTAFLEPSLLLVLGFGFGLAHGFLYPSLAALVAEGVASERRGRALANFNAAFNSGAGLSLLGGGWVARGAGYPALFALVGCVTITSVLSLSAPSVNLLAPPESRP